MGKATFRVPSKFSGIGKARGIISSTEALTAKGKFNLETLQKEFKILSQFENYFPPNNIPYQIGYEVEVHPNLIIEFVDEGGANMKLWSRQLLIHDNSGTPIIKLWNNAMPTLLAKVDQSKIVSIVRE